MTRYTRLLLCAVALAAAAVVSGAGAAADDAKSSPTPETRTLATEWAAALESGNVDLMKPMLASGYVYVNPRGQATDGPALLRQLKEKSLTVKIAAKDRSLRLHQDALVMFGTCEITGEVDGKKVDGPYRYLDVFQRQNDRWVAVASTLTKIEDKP